MLGFDTTRAPETPRDFLRLVEAIYTANHQDETDWLEWKSHLDLSERRDQFILAKGVLGMANRQPDSAEQYCQGLGVIVIGVEPSNQPGVSRLDPAIITDALERYVGSDGPLWSHRYIEHRSRDVLIVSVDPPGRGDRIFCLMKTFDNHPEGSIYVRKSGKTEPAKPQDIRNLEERARHGRLDLRLELANTTPVPWIDPGEPLATIDRIVEGHREKLLRPIRRQRKRASTESPTSQADSTFAVIQQSLQGIARGMENRSESEFREQVETWTSDWRRDAEEAAMVWCARNPEVALRLRVANLTSKNLQALRVELELPKCLMRSAEELTHPEPPKPPAPFGIGYLAALTNPLPIGYPYYGPGVEYDLPDIWVKELDQGQELVWDVGDVRPNATCTSSEFCLIVESTAPVGIIASTWRATAKNIDGLGRGELVLPVRENAIDVAALAEHLEHKISARDTH